MRWHDPRLKFTDLREDTYLNKLSSNTQVSSKFVFTFIIQVWLYFTQKRQYIFSACFWAQYLSQRIALRSSFKTRVSWKSIFYLVSSYSPKSTEMIRPQKGNSGVSFNDTLFKFSPQVKVSAYLYSHNQKDQKLIIN